MHTIRNILRSIVGHIPEPTLEAMLDDHIPDSWPQAAASVDLGAAQAQIEALKAKALGMYLDCLALEKSLGVASKTEGSTHAL